MSKVSNKCITCGGHIDNSKSIELLEQAKSEKSTLSSSLEELNAKFKE
jgi:hypothetical protein